MKFKLLRGLHESGARLNTVLHSPGAVIETDTDLVAKFGRQKFERLPEDTPTQVVQAAAAQGYGTLYEGPGLEAMSVEELRALAEREEIDLQRATGKREIVKRIRAAMVGEERGISSETAPAS